MAGRAREEENLRYTVYKADINNDGIIEFVLTWQTEGSGAFTQPEGVWQDVGGKLIRLPFEKAVAKSLDNGNPDFEWCHVQIYLACPFLMVKDGTVYFGFDDFEYYVWKGDKVYREDP